MKNLQTFEEFLNESLNEAERTVGPKFVEDFLTNKRESFNDRFAFYGWVRKNLPTVFKSDNITYDSASSLADKASKKYPEYDIRVVGGDRNPEDCQVWCSVSKSVNRVAIYNVLIGHATSSGEIDSLIKDFESNIKDLAKS
jgi:hypothetical protein